MNLGEIEKRIERQSAGKSSRFYWSKWIIACLQEEIGVSDLIDKIEEAQRKNRDLLKSRK